MLRHRHLRPSEHLCARGRSAAEVQRWSATDYPGSIYITLELPDDRTGGMVADTADAVAIWVDEFLRHPDQRDVLAKLTRSGAVERHAFVIVPG